MTTHDNEYMLGWGSGTEKFTKQMDYCRLQVTTKIQSDGKESDLPHYNILNVQFSTKNYKACKAKGKYGPFTREKEAKRNNS